jgi:hypothetical protein
MGEKNIPGGSKGDSSEEILEKFLTKERVGQLIDTLLFTPVDDSAIDDQVFKSSDLTLEMIRKYVIMNREEVVEMAYDQSKDITKALKESATNEGNGATPGDISFSRELHVKEVITNTYGKWPLYYGSVALIDYKAFESMLYSKVKETVEKMLQRKEFQAFSFLKDPILSQVKENLRHLNDITLEANVNFKNRSEIYHEKDKDKLL